MSATFYFDPACPWTWLTSRWLVRESDRQGFEITWRSFSLAYANRDREIPEEYRGAVEAAKAAHRIFEALRSHKDEQTVPVLYEVLGHRVHGGGDPLSVDTVLAVAREAGVTDNLVAVAGDESYDEAVAAQTEEALALCYGDVGSPVLSIREGHGFHGPIIDGIPSVEDGQRLWEAVVALAGVPQYFELKRGRSGEPETAGT
jgi:2-hydroxychromene-2-carboxylate isomerase